jgi:hypothetical protein
VFCLALLEALARIVVVTGNPPQYGYRAIDSKVEVAAASRKDPLPQVFFLGSSYTAQGVCSELITYRLNQSGYNISAYNLAFSKARPLDQLWLLRTAFRNKVPPAAVVCEVSFDALALPKNISTTYTKELQSSYMRFWKRENSLLDSVKFILGNNFYLFRYRSYLRQFLLDAPSVVFAPDGATTHFVTNKVNIESSLHGWMPGYSIFNQDSYDKTAQFESERLLLAQHLDGRALKYYPLVAVSDFCARNHIPVILLWLPTYPSFQSWKEKLTGISVAQFRETLMRDAGKYHLDLIDLHDDSDQAHYSNPDHLNAIGAICVSERIAQKLTEPPFDEMLRKYKRH